LELVAKAAFGLGQPHGLRPPAVQQLVVGQFSHSRNNVRRTRNRTDFLKLFLDDDGRG